MSTRSLELDDVRLPSAQVSAEIPVMQQLYWSVRRELWENRAVWLAPVIVAVVAFGGFLVTLPTLPRHVARLSGPEMNDAHLHVHGPYGAVAIFTMAIAFLVGVYFAAETLQGERRDRSMLFWKSMPVSDTTTVLSKAMIPLVVLPLVVFAATVATHVLMMALSAIVLMLTGGSVGALMAHVVPFQSLLTMLYMVFALAAWHAPIYGWLLLVSAWAPRAALLWAAVPLIAVGAIENTVYGTTRFFESLKYLTIGLFNHGFAFTDDIGTNLLQAATPMRLLSLPSVWIGLVFTAACVAAAIQLRRRREPT